MLSMPVVDGSREETTFEDGKETTIVFLIVFKLLPYRCVWLRLIEVSELGNVMV